MSNELQHWTDDPEQLENYVLGRVEGSRRRPLEEHLRSCAQCREAVEREQRLIRGIRRYGREELKHRLSKNIAVQPGRVPWPRILSAAAVVVILVGLGVYNRWWLVETPIVQSEQEIGTVEERDEDRSVPADETPRVTERPPAARGAELLEEGSSRTRERAEPTTMPAPARSPRLMLEDRMDRAEKKSDLPAQLWVEGILLDPAEGKLTRDRREGAAGAGEAAALAPDERISAVQKSLSDIPRLQQGKQQPKTVLTSMEQSTEGLHLVFYSDDLRLGNEVRVDRAGPDSIVVTVNGVRIAYKIPTGWLPVTK